MKFFRTLLICSALVAVNAAHAEEQVQGSSIASTITAAVNRILVTDSVNGSTVSLAECAVGEVLRFSSVGWSCFNLSSIISEVKSLEKGNIAKLEARIKSLEQAEIGILKNKIAALEAKLKVLLK